MRCCAFLLLDLSTLANVVTTLAAMGNEREDNTAIAPDSILNGETSSAESVGSDQASKAFDVLTKALKPQLEQVMETSLLFSWL